MSGNMIDISDTMAKIILSEAVKMSVISNNPFSACPAFFLLTSYLIT